MKKLFTLIALLATVVSGAWATDLTTMVGQIGKSDNTVAAFIDHTKNVVIKDGETYVYTLTNYNAGEGNYYNNWIFEAFDSNKKYIGFRADGGYWGEAGTNKTFTGTDYNGVTNWMTEYNGATVTLTVTYNDGTMVISNHSILSGGSIYENSLTTTGLSGDMTMRFTNEKSHQFISKVVYTDASGVETIYTASTLTGSQAIVGGNKYESQSYSQILLNSYANKGGAGALSFALGEGFDNSKVTNATLSMYVISKPNKNRSGNINLHAENAMPAVSSTSKNDGNGAYVYSCGSSTYKRYTFSSTAISTVAGSAYTNSNPKNNTYFDFDISSYIKGLTTKTAGDNVYFGIDVSDWAAEIQVGAKGYDYSPILEITSVNAVFYTATFTETSDLNPAIKIYSDANRTTEVSNGSLLNATTYYYRATLTGYKDYDGQFTASGANPSVNFTMVAKATYSYTIKTSTGATLASGSDYEGSTISYAYPKYLLVGTTLYAAAKQGSNPWWGKSFTLTSNNQVETVTYTEDTQNVVYYQEAEDMTGATSTSNTNADIRCSNKKGGYGTDVTITTLEPGMYILYTSVWGGATKTIKFYAGTTEIHSVDTKGYIDDTHSAIFTITENTTLTFTGGDSSHPLDYVYILKVPATVPVTIGEAGYATFVTPYPVDFIGNTIEAYAVSEVNSAEGTVTLTKVTTVPEGQAVIVKGTTGNVDVVANAGSITNLMMAAAADIAYDSKATNTNYVLAKVEGNVGLYPVNSGTIAKGKGYLPVAKNNAAKGGFTFVTDNVTAVEMAEAAPAVVKNGKFATAEGIVIVKDGVKYNVAGMKK